MVMVEISETKSMEVNEVKINGFVYTISELYQLLRDTIIPRTVKEKIVCLLIDGIGNSYGHGHLVGFIINPYDNVVTLMFTKTPELAWPITKENSLIFISIEELLKGLDC
jgi:hypothetical protein